MEKLYDLETATNFAKKTNIIIYGTVRNIEINLLSSFSNLEYIAELFNDVMCIILENDSNDGTRDLLNKWFNNKNTKIKKHLILLNNVARRYKRRTIRLAYCRNYILNYIKQNNLESHYTYAIHCDLDDVFWKLKPKTILYCFQYDLKNWDMFGCVNKDCTYYDYWALRYDGIKFLNGNIFNNCHNKNKSYQQYEPLFCNILKNNKILQVNSCFNGLGVYKLSSLIKNNYDGSYNCQICNNTICKGGEDNDHIKLHEKMNVFINTEMILEILPNSLYSQSKSIYNFTYSQFINSYVKNIKNLNINPIKHIKNSNIINDRDIIIEYSLICQNKLLGSYFDNVLYIDNNDFSVCINPISLLLINCMSYSKTNLILEQLLNKIPNNGCIIIFNHFINYNNYWLYELKSFYEFLVSYNIKYEWIGMNGTFELEPFDIINDDNINKDNCVVAVKIFV